MYSRGLCLLSKRALPGVTDARLTVQKPTGRCQGLVEGLIDVSGQRLLDRSFLSSKGKRRSSFAPRILRMPTTSSPRLFWRNDRLFTGRLHIQTNYAQKRLRTVQGPFRWCGGSALAVEHTNHDPAADVTVSNLLSSTMRSRTGTFNRAGTRIAYLTGASIQRLYHSSAEQR